MSYSIKRVFDGKTFIEVDAKFLVHVDNIEQMNAGELLTQIIYMIHDGAKQSGIDARRIIIEQTDE